MRSPSPVTRARLLDVLVSGCDERVAIDPLEGSNKYHLNPVRHEGLFQRGTCTASTLNSRSLGVAERFLESYDEAGYGEIVAQQANRLRTLVSSGGRRAFDVYFGSSGSDLAYYPTMFQRMLNPRRRIVHIVSCPEELGSGSLAASEARFFARSNQFGESLVNGAPISDRIRPQVNHLRARGDNGEILARRKLVEGLIAENPDAAVIVSLVFGSKSGIMDDLEVISDSGGEVQWVVDLCQFRVDRGLVARLLDKGAAVMLTGSKFFGAPPFCAALLVPASLSERLREAPARLGAPFGRIFSAYDVPPGLEALRSCLPTRTNLGLRTRWEVALDEMEAYAAWHPEEANAVIAAWNAGVSARLGESPAFELMPDQNLTNDSIISFEVTGRDGRLGFEQLGKLFEVVVTTEHRGFSGDRTRVFLGQPVRYGEKAFLRLALGSGAVRGFLSEATLELHDDLRLIEVLEEQAELLYGR